MRSILNQISHGLRSSSVNEFFSFLAFTMMVLAASSGDYQFLAVGAAWYLASVIRVESANIQEKLDEQTELLDLAVVTEEDAHRLNSREGI